jgi:uncharacterized membrane protein
VQEILSHAFGWVCGQNPDHVWKIGGLSLPCCQRCTGLYLGALSALLLQAVFQPAVTTRFLKLHGLFLLLMLPFGFHWLPQGPLLRGPTGVLFGFGLVAFLRLKLVRTEQTEVYPRGRSAAYLCGVALSLCGVAAIPTCESAGGFWLVAVLATGGALVLAALAAANLWLGVRWAFRRGLRSASLVSV